MKPFYDEDGITIWCGDMMKLMRQVGQVDAVVTDPPYEETSLEWDCWPQAWPSEVAQKSAQLWCFGSMRMFLAKEREFANWWKLAQDVIWEKHNGSGFDTDRFKRVHEIVTHWYRGKWTELYRKTPKVKGEPRASGVRSNQAKHRSDIKASHYEYSETRLMRSVVKANSCHGYAVHPTQKPEAVVLPLLEYSVPDGGIVLDPFMGSGTTLVAAKARGLRAVGIEINEEYCKAAVERLRQGVLIPG